MRPPRHVNFCPDKALRDRITNYFRSIIGHTRAQVQNKLPNVMQSWGKMRIRNCGDSVRSAMASKKRLNERDSSYVRVRGFISIDQNIKLLC